MSPFKEGGPSPHEMGAGSEAKKGRPTERDFEKSMKLYLFQRREFPHRYEEAKTELEEMAQGGGDPQVREKKFPGWTNEDFQEVLRRFAEEEEKLP